MTTWEPIPGHPDYEVSDAGQLRSWRGLGPSPVRAETPRLLAQHQMPNGYYKARVATMSDHPLWVHRLVALAFHGPCPVGQEVRHLDGDRTNNVPTNLAYGTRSQNNLDAVAHGTNNMTRKTHCPQGHPYDDENTARYTRRRQGRSTAQRVCRTCQRAQSRAAGRKKTGLTVACDTCGQVVSKTNVSRHRRERHTQPEGQAAA